MLAISSGGDHSAYVLGMLKGVFVTQPHITEWDKLCGISAGALIGTKIAQVDTEDRSKFIKSIDHLMNSHQQFTKSWSTMGTIVSMAKAFIWHGALFKSRLQNIVEESWEKKHRELYVGAYNRTEGRYQSFGPDPSIPQVTASASIPVVFDPVKIEKAEYCDGAMAHVIPIKEIKAHWREGDLDVMICYPTNHAEFVKSSDYMTKYQLMGRLYSTISENTWYNLNRDLDDLSDLVGQDVRGGGVFKVGDKTVRVYVPKKGYYCDVVNRDFKTLKKMHIHGEEVAKEMLSTA
jgi:NTE family protein